MANIALITLVLAMFYSMATAGSFKEMMGHPLCEYQKTSDDCEMLGQCLTDAGYTVEDPCDDEQVHAAQVDGPSWPEIFICTWKKTGVMKEDGTCDVEMQTEAIESRMTFENPETKTALKTAVDQCNEDNPKDCTSALFCATKHSMMTCYPDFKMLSKHTSED